MAALLLINCPATGSLGFQARKLHPCIKSRGNIRPQIHCNLEQTARRSANYQPSLWTDEYIQSLPTSSSMEEQNNERIQMLKKGVMRLIHENKEIKSQLRLIDELEQLGVSYHFKDDIHDSLSTVSTMSSENLRMALKDDLYATGLVFRLLRRHGFDVSEDIFGSYIDEKDNFIPSLGKDIKGILSLYEASYLAKHGERLLDKANVFAITQLRHLLEGPLDPRVKEHVEYALELPLDWRMQILHNRWFIETCKVEDLQSPILRELAILNYNYNQLTFKKEMKLASRWWAKLDLANKIPFARHRFAENYYLSVGVTSDLRHGDFRDAITKAYSLVTIIDDIYDLYGTLDELELFTNAVNRWDANAINELPEYMQISFLALFNTFNDVAHKVMRKEGLDVTPHLKRAWAGLCNSYLVEAKWYRRGYKPKLEEYLENALISIAGPLTMTIAHCLSEHVTIGDLESSICPTHTKSSSIIFRLCNDLGTSKDELQRGDVLKAIQCYMHCNDVSEFIASKHINEIIRDNWKHMNGIHTYRTLHDKYCKNIAINYTRTAHYLYQYGDGYAKPDIDTKERITSMLIEPIYMK